MLDPSSFNPENGRKKLFSSSAATYAKNAKIAAFFYMM